MSQVYEYAIVGQNYGKSCLQSNHPYIRTTPVGSYRSICWQFQHSFPLTVGTLGLALQVMYHAYPYPDS